MLKPVPFTLACVMFSVAVPVLVTVTCCDWLLPTLTAKLALVGFNATPGEVGVGEDDEAMPVPVTAIVFIPPDVRSKLKERFPEKVLAESGRKVTWNVALLPAAKLAGREGPARTNSGRLATA